jgi:hypothetical protein
MAAKLVDAADQPTVAIWAGAQLFWVTGRCPLVGDHSPLRKNETRRDITLMFRVDAVQGGCPEPLSPMVTKTTDDLRAPSSVTRVPRQRPAEAPDLPSPAEILPDPGALDGPPNY